jgi:hypothetical protein
MEGLDKFREAFKDFSDNYVIIGGTACDITMTGTEVRARATHDIDMNCVKIQIKIKLKFHYIQYCSLQ